MFVHISLFYLYEFSIGNIVMCETYARMRKKVFKLMRMRKRERENYIQQSLFDAKAGFAQVRVLSRRRPLLLLRCLRACETINALAMIGQTPAAGI